MPPTTTTMKARSVKSAPMFWVTPPRGPKSTPLAAAMAAPMAKTPVWTNGTGMPMAEAMTRSCMVARIQMPYLPYLEEEAERADDGGGEDGGGDAVPRVLQVEELELPGDRLLDLAGRRPPLPERVLLQHERHAEGGEDGGEGIAAEQRPQRGHLERGAEHRDDERGHEQGEPEAPGRRDAWSRP